MITTKSFIYSLIYLQYRQQSMNQPHHFNEQKRDYITVVSGLPRSGTSMLMKMLEKGDISPYVDNIRVADSDNPEGYYEYDPVKKLKENNLWLSKCKGYSIKIVSPLIKNILPGIKYKVIFIDRDIKEILASQNKMLLNRGEVSEIDDETMAAYYSSHLIQIKNWLDSQHNIELLYVNYNETLQEPLSTSKLLSEFLDISIELDLISSVVRTNLYRNRRN